MSGPGDAEEYDGPARLVVDGRSVVVRARLAGHFEPVTGRYQWTGRVDADDAGRAALRPNITVELQTEGHAAEAVVREEDPWGGFRVTGSGRPPFAVPAETP